MVKLSRLVRMYLGRKIAKEEREWLTMLAGESLQAGSVRSEIDQMKRCPFCCSVIDLRLQVAFLVCHSISMVSFPRSHP